MYKPGDQLQETVYCCACKQGFLCEVLNHALLGPQVLLSVNDMQINFTTFIMWGFFSEFLDDFMSLSTIKY